MLQPPLPLPRRRAWEPGEGRRDETVEWVMRMRSWNSWRYSWSFRKIVAAGSYAGETEGWRSQSSHLLTDDKDARYSGGLLTAQEMEIRQVTVYNDHVTEAAGSTVTSRRRIVHTPSKNSTKKIRKNLFSCYLQEPEVWVSIYIRPILLFYMILILTPTMIFRPWGEKWMKFRWHFKSSSPYRAIEEGHDLPSSDQQDVRNYPKNFPKFSVMTVVDVRKVSCREQRTSLYWNTSL